MRIVTGLEVVIQQMTDLSFNQKELDYVQDAIDYIELLEKKSSNYKAQLISSIETCIHLNDCLPHPSASDDFVYRRELKALGDNQ